MSRVNIVAIACIFAYAAAPDPIRANMIGVSWSDTNSPVVQIDENTGIGMNIGLSGFTGLNSLAIDNAGALYSAVDNLNATPPLLRLVTINPATGVGSAGPALNFGTVRPAIRALAFSSQNVLYAVNNTGPPGETITHDLYTIDVGTGVGTQPCTPMPVTPMCCQTSLASDHEVAAYYPLQARHG
jgi:hypothetical protein